tara:strand:+ start:203 stop:505 length:303 start_codon:yes stop_codon:yes gene_type:complete
MKFMVTWSVEDEDKWLDILDMWSSLSPEQRADVGDSVKMIGRWHDLNSKQGVAIMETSDLSALNSYLNQWNPFMSIDAVPVLDDEESAAVSKEIVASHRG